MPEAEKSLIVKQMYHFFNKQKTQHAQLNRFIELLKKKQQSNLLGLCLFDDIQFISTLISFSKINKMKINLHSFVVAKNKTSALHSQPS